VPRQRNVPRTILAGTVVAAVAVTAVVVGLTFANDSSAASPPGASSGCR